MLTCQLRLALGRVCLQSFFLRRGYGRKQTFTHKLFLLLFINTIHTSLGVSTSLSFLALQTPSPISLNQILMA